MTRRERAEARLQRRMAWAESRDRKASAAFNAAHSIADNIPLGQPILVGHHSERRARRDAERIQSNMDKGCESMQMAQAHRSKAGGIADQLDRTIFSDDTDAKERIAEKIAGLEEKIAMHDKINKAWRKGKGQPGWHVGVCGDRLAETTAETMRQCPWIKSPCDNTSARAEIRRLRKRAEEIDAEAAQIKRAEEADGGVLVERFDRGYCHVTFPDYPGRAIVQALKDAGFRWSRPVWVGATAKLPEGITTQTA